MICTRCLTHSLAVVEAIVLLVAVGKVAVLEGVIARVASTSDAMVIVASALLKVVDVKAVAPVLESDDSKVEVLPVVVTSSCFLKEVDDKAADSKGLRLEGTEL